MRGFLACGVAIVMGLGLASPAGAGDAAQKESSNWFSRMFSRRDQPIQKDAGPKDLPPARAESKPATVVEAAAVQRARELAAWRRRVEVCDKLREIALSNQDDNLVRKADQLDQRAWDTYVGRTAHLPGGQEGLARAEANLPRLLGQEGGVRQREEAWLRTTRPAESQTAGRRMGHE